MNENHRHSWGWWDNENTPWWIRQCDHCGKTQRKNELNFIEWLWNLVPVRLW